MGPGTGTFQTRAVLCRLGQLVTLTGVSSFLLFPHLLAGAQDSPINKLLYARDIPRYKQMVERYRVGEGAEGPGGRRWGCCERPSVRLWDSVLRVCWESGEKQFFKAVRL